MRGRVWGAVGATLGKLSLALEAHNIDPTGLFFETVWALRGLAVSG